MDAPLDIWGGGGSGVFVGCKLYFTSARKQSFFCDERPTIVFLIFVAELKYIFLLCTLPFGGFSGQHIFSSISTTNFFSDHIFNNFFFLGPPPPQISHGAPLRWLSMSTRLFPPSSLRGRPTPIECDAEVTMWR